MSFNGREKFPYKRLIKKYYSYRKGFSLPPAYNQKDSKCPLIFFHVVNADFYKNNAKNSKTTMVREIICYWVYSDYFFNNYYVSYSNSKKSLVWSMSEDKIDLDIFYFDFAFGDIL
jgi:hypothetical protein